MTQHDPEAWLEQARQGLAPREADQARVLAALERRLDLSTSDAASELGAAQRQALNAASPGVPASALGVPSTLLRWALGAIVPIAGVAAISVMLKTRDAEPKQPVLRPATAVTAAISELDVPSAELAQHAEPSAPEPAVQGPTPAPVPAPKEKRAPRKKCRTAQGAERPCTSVKPAETAVAVAPQPTAAAPASSLSEELAALRGAQRALREGRAAEALAVLTSFEQSVPGRGAMQEERNAAATMARCALARQGDATSGSAQELYDGFMQRYPKSAYAARLARTCLVKTPR